MGAALFEAASDVLSAATSTVYGVSTGAVNLATRTVGIAAESLAPKRQPVEPQGSYEPVSELKPSRASYRWVALMVTNCPHVHGRNSATNSVGLQTRTGRIPGEIDYIRVCAKTSQRTYIQ
jgi:hypothetical protein